MESASGKFLQCLFVWILILFHFFSLSLCHWIYYRNEGFSLPCSCSYITFFLQRASPCCRKGDSFQGPRVGSCLTVGNELSEETHVLTKQETLLGRGAPVENSRVRTPGELLCHMVHSLGF